MEPNAHQTPGWSSEELDQIGQAEELQIASVRANGTMRRSVPIWVARVADDLYVRAAYGPDTGWHRTALDIRQARIQAGGIERDVTVQEAAGPLNDQLDAAYRAKYARYAGPILDGIINPQARGSTLRLIPIG